MSADLTFDLSATASDLLDCLNTIEESCIRWNMDRATISRLRVVVEELFSNTIKYGYGGECARPVRLRVRCSPRVELIYEDEAPAFDPTTWRDTTPPEIGRNGISLVLGMAHSARYERLPAGNRLTLGLR